MKFIDGGADLPDPLIRSLSADRLVVFVGAGASARAFSSQPKKSFYPTFRELTLEVASRLDYEFTDSDRAHLKRAAYDRLLGEWEHTRGEVRSLSAQILSEEEQGKRTDLHRSIVRLFLGRTPRIVTTNFDRLLLRALQLEGLSSEPAWKIHVAPALAPARRLSGICFLHGSIDEPREMVLTDKDIGRAYMEEGWALQFAHDMFRNFDVLFVGYSLEDPPLRYLSLALEGNTTRGRWALVPSSRIKATDDLNEQDWMRRNVEPIWYPAPRKDFRALERTLEAWGNDNSRTFIDRSNVLSSYAASKPSHLRPHDLDRVRYFLEDSPSLRDFARSDLNSEWFGTLRDWGHFDFLLRGKGDHRRECDGALVERLVHWIVLEKEDFVGRLSPDRNTINAAIFGQFCWRLERDPKSIPVDSLRKILEFFRPTIERRHGVSNSITGFKALIVLLVEEGHEDDALWLFARLLRVFTSVSRRSSFHYGWAVAEGQDTVGLSEYELHFELTFDDQLSEYLAKSVLTNLLVPRITTIGAKVFGVLMHELMQMRATQSRLRDLPPSNYLRAAIEPNEQDRVRTGPLSTLIDLLRDYWDEALRLDPPLAIRILESWEGHDDSIVQRLHLYGLGRLIAAGH